MNERSPYGRRFGTVPSGGSSEPYIPSLSSLCPLLSFGHSEMAARTSLLFPFMHMAVGQDPVFLCLLPGPLPPPPKTRSSVRLDLIISLVHLS